MNLKLTGSQTLTLTDGTTAIMTAFEPDEANVEVKEVDLFVDLVLLGTRTQVQATKDIIDTMFSEAKQAQSDLTLDRTYVEVETSSGYVRSELIEGVLLTDTNYYHNMGKGFAPVRVQLKRKNYWEGAEAQIPLTNENGSNNTAGLKVYNTNDLTGTAPDKRVNYVGIAGSNVAGSIPTPPRIEMTNTYSNADTRVSNVWLGRSVDNATYPLQWFINHSATLSTANSTEIQISLTTLNTTFLNGTNGGHYRVFVKLGSSYSDLRLRAALYFPASVALTPMQKAPEVVTGGYSSVDLGTLQIPPWLPNLRGQTDIGLRLTGRRAGGFSITALDYFFFPANAFRQLIPRGYGIAQTIRLVDDGIVDRVWTDGWTPAGKTGHYSGYGDLITLIPGKDQRLLFLWNTMTGGVGDDLTMSVKLYYRPRRLTP